MAQVDEPGEVRRLPETGGRREVPADLISPGASEGVLGDRHQLEVGVAEPGDVLDQLLRQLAVPEGPPPLPAAPGAEVDLVNGNRLPQPVALAAAAHPVVVAPLESGDVADDRGGARRRFRPEGVRVGLEQEAAARGPDLVLVDRPGAEVGDEQLPDARGAAKAHGMAPPVPAVEVPDDADPRGGRSPDGERHPVTVPQGAWVGTQEAVRFAVSAFVEQVLVAVADKRPEGIGVAFYRHPAAAVGGLQLVGKGVAAGNDRLEQALGMDAPALETGAVGGAHRNRAEVRPEDTHSEGAVRPRMHPEKGEGVVVLGRQEKPCVPAVLPGTCFPVTAGASGTGRSHWMGFSRGAVPVPAAPPQTRRCFRGCSSRSRGPQAWSPSLRKKARPAGHPPRRPGGCARPRR